MWKVIRWQCFVLQPWKFQASAEYESDHSADGRRGCCCCNRISSLVIHMLHKYIIKTLVTCNNSLDWLSECEFLWCASSQTDQSGLWVLADRHPWLLSTITTLIIPHASYCRALPFERSNQTADERLNNHAALNVLGIAHVRVCVCGGAAEYCTVSASTSVKLALFVRCLLGGSATTLELYGLNRETSSCQGLVINTDLSAQMKSSKLKLFFSSCLFWDLVKRRLCIFLRTKSMTTMSSYCASCCIISDVTASFSHPS